MRTVNEEARQAKKIELMEKCYDCYAENGLSGVGIKTIAKACGCNAATLYLYFENLDDLIIKSTAYCMAKVEDDFMAKAPADPKDVIRFIEEIPYWTAKEHGKKYRLMYQVYTHPKFIEHGKKFFEGVNERYTEYAKQLEPKIGIPHTVITPLIFILVRVMLVSPEQLENAPSQMEVTLFGIFMLVIPEQFSKAPTAMEVTGFPSIIAGISTEPPEP